MDFSDFDEVVARISLADRRYHADAYLFLRAGLDYTLKKMIERGEIPKRQHITGQQLLEGLRAFALEQFGPLTQTVLSHWGISRCEDFGNMVFHLVNYGQLGKQDGDDISDFSGGYDFGEVFGRPFRPEGRP